MVQPHHVIPASSGKLGVGLILSLLLSLLILPLLEGLHVGRLLLLSGLTLTFIFGTIALRVKFPVISVLLLAIAVSAAWATMFIDSTPIFLTHCVLGSLFFWFVGLVIVVAVVKTPVVTHHSVSNAISAYLLFGLAWALCFQAIYRVSPEAFSVPAADRASTDGAAVGQLLDFSSYVYFSFVTMATLGYGDIAPVGRLTRTLTWIQAVTGQF